MGENKYNKEVIDTALSYMQTEKILTLPDF
jgi:hypothetical protein